MIERCSSCPVRRGQTPRGWHFTRRNTALHSGGCHLPRPSPPLVRRPLGQAEGAGWRGGCSGCWRWRWWLPAATATTGIAPAEPAAPARVQSASATATAAAAAASASPTAPAAFPARRQWRASARTSPAPRTSSARTASACPRSLSASPPIRPASSFRTARSSRLCTTGGGRSARRSGPTIPSSLPSAATSSTPTSSK